MERLNQVNMQFAGAAAASSSDKKDSLSVTDNRTGKQSHIRKAQFSNQLRIINRQEV